MDPKLLLVLVACGLFAEAHILKHHIVVRSADDADEDSIDDDWWRTGIFYQIYPRSFMDTNGDGNGDLQGIISKLDHLKDMGVTAAWLSPIYESPDVDQGYDISNYTAIDEKYGTLEDLKSLIDKAHELGIKIIMDFVPNHTSDQHDWFLKSVAKSVENDIDYTDFYIWRDTPNNWISVFSDSAWDYNKTRGQYYLHQFSSGQPDLNYSNPDVVTAMKGVLTYWLDVGVDGFRMDAVPVLFEDDEFKDEPLSGNGVESNQYGYLKHIYTTNLDETYDMIYQFRAHLDEYNNQKQDYSRIMMTEAYTDLAEQAVAYYGNNTHSGAHFTFNFNLITGLSSSFSVDDIINNVNKWLSHLPKKYVSNWVLGNHDQHRIATRLGVGNIDAYNMLTAFLPGIQVTYMGEEIGMEDGYVNCSQGYDPQAKDCTTFNETSRDFERTPFQWENSTNAGFSNTSETWLPVSDKYKTTNLKAQNVEGIKSHYNVYKSMVAFRQNFKNISYDAVSLIKVSDNVLEIVRTTDKAEFVYLFNCADKDETVSVYTNNQNLAVLVAGINSQFSNGDILPNPVTLKPHESIVLQGDLPSSANKFALSTWMSSLLFVLLLNKFY